MTTTSTRPLDDLPAPRLRRAMTALREIRQFIATSDYDCCSVGGSKPRWRRAVLDLAERGYIILNIRGDTWLTWLPRGRRAGL